MKTPARLQPLLEDGIIDHVIKPLRSGKEADVYVVVASDEVRCAKIYKEKVNRSFHNQVLYQEGRHTKNSRSNRAMGKHTKYGKQMEEEEWQNSEVDTLFRLHNGGVRVPVPHICSSGVLIMELLLDADGEVAPQLGDIEFDEEEAIYCHGYLMREVVLMLLAGIVHADLSEFNIVMTWNGPVIIDFPQSVDATSNNNAQFFLERDVRNLAHFFGRYAPQLIDTNYGLEIWQHYSAGTLTLETKLTGKPVISGKSVNIESVLKEIDEAREEALKKAARLAGIVLEDEDDENPIWEPKRKVRAVEVIRNSGAALPKQTPNHHKQENHNNNRGSKSPAAKKSAQPFTRPSVEKPTDQTTRPMVEKPMQLITRPTVEMPSRPLTPSPTTITQTAPSPIQWGRR